MVIYSSVESTKNHNNSTRKSELNAQIELNKVKPLFPHKLQFDYHSVVGKKKKYRNVSRDEKPLPSQTPPKKGEGRQN